MRQLEARSICILGRQPALGLAELESLYGAEHIQPLKGAALLSMPTEEINFKRLGGTIKLAKVLNILPTTDFGDLEKYLADTIPEHLKYLPGGTFRLGLSLYNFNIPAKSINQSLLKLKKIIRSSDRSVRVVPNKSAELNSAQVLHNKLTTKGGWELLLVRDGQQTILAQSFFVQDIEAYAARDQVRPKRDARVGMLPPKLAQIIINLAAVEPKGLLLDPFCGSGVILQEALLMGFSVYGSDNDPRMIDYAKTNLKWLIDKHPQINGHVALEVVEAMSGNWPRFSALASEIYLGKPLSSLPPSSLLDKIVAVANEILEKFLRNLAGQEASKNKPLCLAVPAWRLPNDGFKHLPVLDKLTDMGYNYLDLKHVRREDLIYYRSNQIVARQLIRLKRV